MDDKKIYDAIIVFETDFQKTIIDKIICDYYVGKLVLQIDARNFSVKVEERVFHINLNGFKKTTSSIIDLLRFPHLHTKELLCTAFPGIGCRMFPSIIDHETLVLIDDGSGTPAILKSGVFLTSLNLKIRFYYASILTTLLKSSPLKYTDSLIHDAKKYYCIYNFVTNDFSKYTKKLQIIYVDYFKRFEFKKIISGQIGFVSSLRYPKNSLLEKVAEKCGENAIYYPHPHEDISNVKQTLVKEIVYPDTILEQYFMYNGIPEILYGEPSTVFINLRQSGYQGEINIFHESNYINTSYYQIFSNLNINMICIN